jgi:hypothetical protein
MVFDRVVRKTTHGDESMPAADFLALPLTERVRLILERNVAFYLGEKPVSASKALAGLRKDAADPRR